MPWIAPVTNRTQETPGYCNAKDLNRLETDCAQLGQLLGVSIAAKTWTRADWPTVLELGRIRGNIAALRGAYYTYRTTPPTPDNPLNTWQKWNSAEEILADIYKLYHKNLDGLLRCGEGWAGEEIGVM